MKNNKVIEYLILTLMGLFIACTVISFSYTQDDVPATGEWRWAADTLEPTDDKQVHAVGSFGLYYFLVCKGVSPTKSLITVSSLGLIKEGIDAMVPWEMHGRLGWDGFSKNDLAYNLLGVGIAYTIDNLWKGVDVKYNNNNSLSFVYRIPK